METKMNYMIRSFCILVLLLLMKSLSMGIDIPDQLKDYYNTQSAAFRVLPDTELDHLGQQFAEFVASNWKAIGQDFDSFVPDLRHQGLVLAAAELLPPHAYVGFANTICDKIAEGKVSREIIENFVSGRKTKAGFFELNYDTLEVRALLSRFKRLLPADKNELRSVLDSIESGEAKASFIRWRKMNDEPLPSNAN
jgi:hypothetical protein